MRSPEQPRKPGPEQPRPTRPLTPEEQEDARILAHLEQSGGAFAAGQPWHVDEPVQQPQAGAQGEWKTSGLLAEVPGDIHKTYDGAMVDASQYIWNLKPANPALSPHNVEYGATIYKLPGKDKDGNDQYSYTPPYTNEKPDYVQFHDKTVPKGATVEAFTHNHPLIAAPGAMAPMDRHKFSDRGNRPGAGAGDVQTADHNGRPLGLVTGNPFPGDEPATIIKKYMPARKDAQGRIIPGGVTQYDEKTKTFGPETTVNRPPARAPEWIGGGKGTRRYRMPNGTEVEVPKDAPPPPWPPEEKKGKDKTKNDERGRQGGENRRGPEVTRALT